MGYGHNYAGNIAVAETIEAVKEAATITFR